jgi:hypothetical protein
MMLRVLKVAAPLAILSGVFSHPVVAEEVKILDSLGLTRAVRTVSDPATVIVRIASEKGEPLELQPLLSNVDGIASDIPAVRDSDGNFVFSGLVRGIWQLKDTGEGNLVSEVRIVP